MIDLLALLRRPHVAPPAARPAATPVAFDSAVDTPRGCGWFDSSHDLRCGLLVKEDLGPEALTAAALPLTDGPALHLRG